MCCISLVPEIFGDTVHPARPRCCRRRRWSGLAGDRQEWPAMASRWPAISPYEPPSAACAWAMDHLNDARSRRRGLVHRDPSMRRRQGLRARGGDGRGQHALVLLQAPARRRAGHNSKHKRTHMHRHTLFLVSGRGRARRRRVRTKRATQRLIRHRKRRKKQAEQRARRRLSAAEASGGWRRDTVTEEDADGDGRRRREPVGSGGSLGLGARATAALRGLDVRAHALQDARGPRDEPGAQGSIGPPAPPRRPSDAPAPPPPGAPLARDRHRGAGPPRRARAARRKQDVGRACPPTGGFWTN
ncbi:unnamed protein product, partial [Prorocentrum cordatum]